MSAKPTMPSPPLKTSLAFILGAVVAVTLATLLVRVRYQLEVSRETLLLRVLLERAGGDIEAELEQGEQTLAVARDPGPRDGWHGWRLDADGYRDRVGRVPPIPEPTLRRALDGRDMPAGSTKLLGLFATESGRNVVVLARREGPRQGATAWTGSWVVVDDIMLHSPVAELVRRGYRLQLYDLAEQAPLYQSDDAAPDSPVAVAIGFRGAQLELRGAPRRGWAVPVRLLASSLLVLLAVLLWLSYELHRRQMLQQLAAESAQAEERRRQVNVLYGKALENIAGLESRLQMVSLYDTVTGLANRSFLLQRIEAVLDSMRQASHGTLSVMALGFDHMHHITNSFGSQFASRVLVIAAERLEFVLPSKDLLFRTGDFQLAVVLPDADAARSMALAERIVAEVASPIALDSHTFMLHPAIGIVGTASGYEYAEALLDHANAALDAVAPDAPSRCCLFDSTTAKESISRLQLEVDLDRAFTEGQFVLEYEPFVVAGAQSVAGFEALIRWNHPTQGRLSPGRFVPIAVQAGMSHRLNDWVVREAIRQAAAWRRAGHRDLFVNFNLSAEAFLRPDLADEIATLLVEFELPGEQLVVELTESTLVQDIRGAARILQRLSELGVRAWLDDFGTGYSSLSHLRNLPLKGVKIDRSFVELIVVEARDFGFLKALIDLIGYLGMQSIVEGIETLEQYELLSLTSCNLYQGYYFARSMPAAEAERWMKEANPGSRQSRTA
jgi:diguanylate cyclase (GGDEF)-like protein